MPKLCHTTHVPEFHRKHIFEHSGRAEAEAAIELVCNTRIPLPEDKVGSPIHLPCCWLGNELNIDVDEAVLAKKREQRLGWKRMKYLLIVPSVNHVEVANARALDTGLPGGAFLRNELEKAGIDNHDVMVTYVNRFALPKTLNKYTARHKKDNLVYMLRDIDEIKPDVVITLGSDCLKALYGRNAKLDTYRGNVLEYASPEHTCPVIPSVSPYAFLGGHANISVFRKELRRAKQIVEGVYSTKKRENDYTVCETLDDVKALCERIRLDKPHTIAFDTEFGNDVAREEFTYTLSIQLAWGAGKSSFIKLRDQAPQDPYWHVDFVGKPRKTKNNSRKTRIKYVEPPDKCGVPMHSKEDEFEIWKWVSELLRDRSWKLAAHHLRVDVEQFARNGFPIDERIADGLDTMLIHHLLYGDEDQGLDHLVRKYVPWFGAFWMELEEWLDANKRKDCLQFGYRNIPLEILVPYALKDADTTWQIAEKLVWELRQQPKLCKLYEDHVSHTSLHILDMERNGILVDERQRAELYDSYKPVYDDLLKQLKDRIEWPEFNPQSRHNMATLLFATTRHREKKAAPKHAKVFDLEPLFNTDKYPKAWPDIVQEGESNLNFPSTKAAVLDLLHKKYPDMPELRLLKHLSVIGKFLTSYLSPQVLNKYGVVEDGKGFHNNIHRDGRVRTHISQLTQTGRYSSRKANLQTKPKKQEAAAFEALVDYYFSTSVSKYKERCEPDYTGEDRIEVKDQINVPKFASCFIAPPGYVLIEADFATAEMCIWAYCSGDPALIAVVDAGRDMHSEVAVKAFKLAELQTGLNKAILELERGDRVPYDEWAKLAKKQLGPLRVAAKTVNFGKVNLLHLLIVYEEVCRSKIAE